MTSREIAQWYEEQELIYKSNKESERMALSEFEERIVERERERGRLLEEAARLEGRMSATTKVEQSHVYDILCLLREVIERQK